MALLRRCIAVNAVMVRDSPIKDNACKSAGDSAQASGHGGCDITVAPIFKRHKHHRAARTIVLGAIVVLIAVAVILWVSALNKQPNSTLSSVAPIASAVQSHHRNIAYVDNQLCLGCHQQQAQQWQQSHHALAMASPTEHSVRGDFHDTTFVHQGIKSRFFMRDGKYFVNTDGADGALADFEISYTFGIEPLQQYLIALPGGRLQPLQIAWDDVRKRWFHLRPDEQVPPGDVLHWTGRYQTANTMCLSCHTTGFEKKYDASSETFASRWAEPNVSCQACHGPGEEHVRWAQAAAKNISGNDVATTNFGLTVNTRALNGPQKVDLCATCHSRRSELDPEPIPGAPRFDNYLPLLLTDNLYHADGQQLDEVFVDGSFRQSKMYAHSVSCTDCHNSHTGKLKLEGNALCLQCHNPKGNPLFATAAGNYDSPAHHFHQAGSAGAQCVSCHMPAKNYMQIQARPDHSIRIPRPDLSIKIGAPNACNNCHSDKSPQWAADHVVAWYGAKPNREVHYGEIFAAARAGNSVVPQLEQLVLDLKYPAIVRATAVHYLSDSELRHSAGVGIDARVHATRDADPEVRAAAAESLAAIAPDQRLRALAPLLSDPLRAVRIAAANALSSIPAEQMNTEQRHDFDNALAEYIAAQKVALDMPGAQFNLGVVYQNTGKLDLAEQYYLSALRIDPDFVPARSNLATLYNALSRNDDAERVLVEGLQRQPRAGDLQYSLGLLLAEEKRMAEAADALTQAARLLPNNARVHYSLGLALQHLNRRKPAEAALLKAFELAPDDAAIPYALAIFYRQSGQYDKARIWTEKLQALAPNDARSMR